METRNKQLMAHALTLVPMHHLTQSGVNFGRRSRALFFVATARVAFLLLAEAEGAGEDDELELEEAAARSLACSSSFALANTVSTHDDRGSKQKHIAGRRAWRALHAIEKGRRKTIAVTRSFIVAQCSWH
jgi:hypothetical protein